MSIDMYLDLSQQQGESISSVCSTNQNSYSNLSQAINAFVNDNQLEAAAYKNAKGYFSQVHVPLIKGAILLSEKIAECTQKFPKEYIESVDSISLKESELESELQAVEDTIVSWKRLRDVLKKADSNSSLSFFDWIIRINENRKNKLKDLLEKLRSFHATSPSIFSEIADLEIDLQSGLAEAQSGKGWDASTGRFSVDSLDMNWAKKINSTWDNIYSSEKAKFILMLQERYGYDEETAALIYKMRQGLDEKFPEMSEEEKDFLFNRILGEINYSGFNWDHTAGDLASYFSKMYEDERGYSYRIKKSLEEIFQDLGISKEEFAKLRYNIAVQHEFSGSTPKSAEDILKSDKDTYNSYKKKAEAAYGPLTNEQFNRLWNNNRKNFSNKADYTHQSVTTATILNDNWLLANLMGNRKELAGWRGDATREAEKTPSMGNDDYKADLDAVNISAIMKDKNLSYIEASNQYYAAISDGDYTRVEAFDKNTGIDYTTKEVLNSLSPPNYKKVGQNYVPVEKTEQEKWAYVKEHYPDSYNFLMSLKDNQNEMQSYYE
ncbi:hypothetical protein I6N96_10305 [Enterococcus sp. BWM-S5]|uniref:LXG domain-containing protein n=1 Tax=Enterococcus larvae TaxID=2794352 RepID=A0ABS4CJ87_9ENTE|nr:hypothetical protein [Enterococcus larvae]MBP1046681.1 hypothetical protein [Enterococcus larvae]